ncbi:MAG: 30S ribosomal protein S20 [Pseudomonadales bacterium]|nr:30S ribosomal protein S20 [Pseudomonadales bacterium]
MANSPQARKRARQAENRRTQNASQRSMVRTYMKRVDAALEAGDGSAASTAMTDASPLIDKMVSKGIMHKNKAARHKSRLNKKIKALQQGS